MDEEEIKRVCTIEIEVYFYHLMSIDNKAE